MVYSIRNLSRGAVILCTRQFFVQLFGMIAGVVLARSLQVSDFGIYAVLTFQFYLHLSIGDLGLGASIIRQKHEPDTSLLRTVQCVRSTLDTIQLILVWFAAPILASWYGGGENVATAFILVALAAWLQSFATVPTILLERKMHFGYVATTELIQAGCFTATCIFAAYSETPHLIIAYGWVLYATLGSLLLFLRQPWSFGFAFERNQLQERLSFALPYQSVQLATIVRDSFTPIAIGFFAGATAVGQMSWATTFALSLPMGSLVLQRLFLPAMSKVQDDPVELGRQLEDALSLTHILILPIAMFLLIYSDSITLLVFGEKWLDALPLFTILWLASLLFPFYAPLFSVLNATGRSGKVLRFTLLVSLGVWIIGLPLLYLAGIMGFAVAYILSQLSIFYLLHEVRQQLSFHLLRALRPGWAIALISLIIFSTLHTFVLPKSIFMLIAIAISGFLLCAAVSHRRMHSLRSAL